LYERATAKFSGMMAISGSAQPIVAARSLTLTKSSSMMDDMGDPPGLQVFIP